MIISCFRINFKTQWHKVYRENLSVFKGITTTGFCFGSIESSGFGNSSILTTLSGVDVFPVKENGLDLVNNPLILNLDDELDLYDND